MLSQEEQIKCRYYLGYLNTNIASSLALGVPAASQTMFLLERAFSNLNEEAEFLVRRALSELDCIEKQLSASRERYGIREVAGTKFHQDEELRLENQFLHWSSTLADIFGVPINPFSLRHQRMNGEVFVVDPC